MATQISSSNSERSQALKEIGVGDTYLSVKTINGTPFLVDQDGKLVNNIRSVSISGEFGKPTVGAVEFFIKGGY